MPKPLKSHSAARLKSTALRQCDAHGHVAGRTLADSRGQKRWSDISRASTASRIIRVGYAGPFTRVVHGGGGGGGGQTNREGEKDIWWTARTARGGTGHLGRTETRRGRLWTACGQRCVDSKNSQTTPATTSTSSIRQLLGAADTQTAHYATFSTVPTRQLLGSANAETTPARAPAAAADRK